MPNNERVGFAQLKVGILGIVALTCIALLVFLLTGSTSWFEKEIPLHVYTSDSDGLTPGAPVRINGIQAGKVKKVQLSGELDKNRIIRIDFTVDEDMQKQIPADSVIAISSDNLLGSSKYLAITKGSAKSFIQADAAMKAADTRQFDQLIQQGYGVLDSLQAILAKVQDIVGQVEVGKGTIGKLLIDESLYNSLQATVNQVQALSTTLNSKNGTIGHLINDDALYSQLQDVVTKVDQIAQSLQDGQGTAGMLLKDPKLANQMSDTLTQLNATLADLNAGKGTAGQLLKDPKIANEISETINKLNVTIDRLNAGQGTLGQLMVNPALYDSATGTTRELNQLLKDFHANPKKYLTIQLKLF
jgi:phospholipid/cholesterol/gamma-HCH transport system substrate-binding protein